MAININIICAVVLILQNILHSALSDLTIIENLVDQLDDIPTIIDQIEILEQSDGLKMYKLGENNEDKDLSATELMEKYGYKTEIHHVTTEDGYKPSIYRIPGDGKPVLLIHGITSSAVDFLTVGPNKALPYLLADEGYDVWMGNCRGTSKDARGHEHLSAEDDVASYWDFSWDEIGRYDLPTMIDYILENTGWKKLKYVGHSQGNTAFFVLCSEKPEYNDKISMAVALSAVAYMSHVKSPLLQLMGAVAPPLSEVIRNAIGFYKITPNNPLIQILVKKMCGNFELAGLVCHSSNFALVHGFDYAQVNVTNLPVIYGHTIEGFATKQLLHYAQLVNSGRFCRYDYGLIKNLQVYGSTQPPEYDIEQISAPIAIFYRRDTDWLVGNEDLKKLISKLPNVVDLIEVPFKKFCHVDYLWAKDVKELVYDKVLKLLRA